MISAVCIVLLQVCAASGTPSVLSPLPLYCEYACTPLGIDVTEPRLGWKLATSDAEARNLSQQAYRVLVASTIDLLGENNGDLWDSGKVTSPDTVHIVYQGKPLKSGQRAYWKVRVWDQDGAESSWSEPSWWEQGVFQADWKANWIEDPRDPVSVNPDPFADHPAPLFRKEVMLAGPVRRARAYVSGLGYYELYLNGERVGDAALDPGWTSYDKRVFYSTYDVTENLKQGENAIGMIGGNGWYNLLPLAMWGRIRPDQHLEQGKPRVILQLVVQYNDGTTETFVTDQSWRVSDSPVVRNSIYLGEHYDARREQPGWNAPGFDDSAWRDVAVAQKPLGSLEAQPIPPMVRVMEIKPVKLTQPSPGVYIFDMGKNFAGRVRLRVSGDSGTRIALRYGELLYADGTLNPMTAVCGQIKNREVPEGSEAPSTAWQEDVYTLRGGSEETYEPHFTWHGFRYVEVTGYPGEPTLDAMDGVMISSGVAGPCETHFTCSNEMFSSLHYVVRRTLLSNLSSVQTDCPHREKFGYGGDIVASSEMAMLNFDMARFYAKTVRDFADAQRENGGFTETAPYVGISDGGVDSESAPPGWGVVHPLLLRQLYQYYGDRRLIEEQYPNAKRWIDLLQQYAVDGILDYGISDHESLDEKPRALTGTVFYYQSAQLVAELAQILDLQDDARKYGALAEEIKGKFNARFRKENGVYDSGTQACQAAALFHQLAVEDSQTLVLDRLVDAVAAGDDHVRTGIFGTKWMLMSLHDYGRDDLAYTIVNQRDFPGWGHMLVNGATTLWEHWEFSDNTYSHNHPMFGSVSEWFVKGLAGIAPAPDAVAFNAVEIAPAIVDDLNWVEARYDSIRGRIGSAWKRDGDGIQYTIEIPPNVRARLHMNAPAASITEGEKSLAEVLGVLDVAEEGPTTTATIGSGTYTFIAKR